MIILSWRCWGLDKVQRKPELFEVLRPIIDDRNHNGQFLVLGSASPQLLKQSSESLAGRISFLELTPFLLTEVGVDLEKDLWLKGGFPRSFLRDENVTSYEWREDFIRNFLERDIAGMGGTGIGLSPEALRRLWRMCAHVHGQTLNLSKLGGALEVSHHTVRKYIDALGQTFLLRVLEPYEANLKKRLVKTPKLCIRDTGLLHTLLEIETMDQLYGHPIFGFSWEGFVIEHLSAIVPRFSLSFFRTSSGVELDLVIRKGQKTVAIETKATSAPTVGRGFWNALQAVKPDEIYIVAPVDDAYPIENNVVVLPLSMLMENPPF